MHTYHSRIRWFGLFTILAALLLLSTPFQVVNAQSSDQGNSSESAIGSTFNYQGQLNDSGTSANGSFDFQFILYDAASGGSQKGSTLKKDKVAVSNGQFNVSLDFGQEVIDGTALYLEVGIKPAGSSSAYTILSPRTGLTAVPYALGMPGVTLQNGTMSLGGDIRMSGSDFVMLPNTQGDGGRALVHDGGDTLTINYGFDFAGGIHMGGPVHVFGNISTDGDVTTDGRFIMNGNDFTIGPSGRGDGGRAMVHWDNDSLIINFGNDFPGGTVVEGNLSVSNGSFIDDGVTLNVPDYVFEKDYKLMSLDELSAFLTTEKHLPGVPSQDEIHKNGLNLGQFHMRLLEKVEELTLYTLAQQKQLDAQQKQINDLAAHLARLEAGN